MLEWWMVTAQSLASYTQAEDVIKVHHLFSASGKTMVHMAKVTVVNWTNCVLKQRDTALSLFTWGISLEVKKDLHNSPIFSKVGLLPSSVLCSIGEQTRQMLQDAALHQTCSSPSRLRPSTSQPMKARPAPCASGAHRERLPGHKQPKPSFPAQTFQKDSWLPKKVG